MPYTNQNCKIQVKNTNNRQKPYQNVKSANVNNAEQSSSQTISSIWQDRKCMWEAERLLWSVQKYTEAKQADKIER